MFGSRPFVHIDPGLDNDLLDGEGLQTINLGQVYTCNLVKGLAQIELRFIL